MPHSNSVVHFLARLRRGMAGLPLIPTLVRTQVHPLATGCMPRWAAAAQWHGMSRTAC